MDRDKDSFRTVSRLEIVGTGRRRRFSDEAKLRIVEEGFSGDGRQVSATALKHTPSYRANQGRAELQAPHRLRR
jgi:transposase